MSDIVEAEGHVTPRAFSDFFEEQHPRLYASMCLVCGNRADAEELAQESFVRVLERWERVVLMEDPEGFLFRIAMNLFRSRYRRERLLERTRIRRTEQPDVFGQIDDRDVLMRALAHLSPRQRAAVVGTTFLGYPSADVGRMLGISDSTVRVLAGRARATLKEVIETR